MADERINVGIEATSSFPPADELRLAAWTLRERATGTTPAPWKATDLAPHGHERTWWVETADQDLSSVVVETSPFNCGENANWVAMMSPDVADPLATVLEAFVGPASRAGWVDGSTMFPTLRAAVDLARKINRHLEE